MSEIKVGEYVRTPEQGWIGKLVEIIPNVLNYYKIDVKKEVRRYGGNSDNYIYSRDGCGLKHSPNIIDLIEVGDIIKYTSGNEIFKDEVWRIKNNKVILTDGNEVKIEDIKSIVTKEQFAESEYKVC